MMITKLLLLLLLWESGSLLLLFVAGANYVPTDKIFLNCGGPAVSTDSDNQTWTTDVLSKFLSSPSTNSLTASASVQLPDVPQVPYMTARIFKSEFTYSFPLAAGRKFLRLYFYPASYAGLNASNGIFSVSSGGYTLLNNFSAFITTQALNFDYVVKEYSLNVPSKVLNVTFTPNASASSYAFINGIEVVSHPDIYSSDGAITVVGQPTGFVIDNSTVLENVYRLNVGGQAISPSDDTGMFRSWNDDLPYIFSAAIGITESLDPSVLNISFPSGSPSYVAPFNVYATLRSMGPNSSVNVNFNLTWVFDIDTGFSYLVRLHFCEVTTYISKVNQRVFTIFLNNQTAEPAADVIAWAGSNGVPYHKDYVVVVPNGPPRQELWLDLHPYTISKPQYYDAILNGLEIFKINSSSGNLAGPNPVPLPQTPDSSAIETSPGHKSSAVGVGIGVGTAAAAVLLVGAIVYLVSRRDKRKKDSTSSDGWLPLSLYGNSHSSGSAKTTTTGSYASSLPSNLGRHFSIGEIQAATNGFDESLLLGVGGFGKVYRGEIDSGTKVAIKRGNPLSEQGVHEFQTEIEMLSKLRHRHLVSLIGYCDDNCEMILVYDYMAYGTLREHLYKTQKPPLPWRQRLEICIGAARGLHYLHTGAKHTIIHRDVKTTNILLDEKWVAKVSDFGLSKTGPSLDHTHVSTVVKGSFGYLDPEYFRRQQLTEKSDVYSFGVVLLEVLCARPALNPSLPKEQVSLAEWGVHCHKKGTLDQIIDPYLYGKIASECFKKYTETAVKCLSDVGMDRPAMGDVLWNLEFALNLQESAEESGMVPKGGGGDMESSSFKGKGFDGTATDSKSSSSGMTMSIGGRSEDSDGLTPSAVFSQIMNPKGR
ncbi:hypothetical protein M569_01631 [Genlisea aurea]|uniref:non-specific serine/threonine protein kinase n=1 Tax=Genlisea aurea TaxID=192259 RepID=S8EB37_9LAMI|nr:hypothetical protein M569_01631 [Genlisea aurea]